MKELVLPLGKFESPYLFLQTQEHFYTFFKVLLSLFAFEGCYMFYKKLTLNILKLLERYSYNILF